MGNTIFENTNQQNNNNFCNEKNYFLFFINEFEIPTTKEIDQFIKIIKYFILFNNITIYFLNRDNQNLNNLIYKTWKKRLDLGFSSRNIDIKFMNNLNEIGADIANILNKSTEENKCSITKILTNRDVKDIPQIVAASINGFHSIKFEKLMTTKNNDYKNCINEQKSIEECLQSNDLVPIPNFNRISQQKSATFFDNIPSKINLERVMTDYIYIKEKFKKDIEILNIDLNNKKIIYIPIPTYKQNNRSEIKTQFIINYFNHEYLSKNLYKLIVNFGNSPSKQDLIEGLMKLEKNPNKNDDILRIIIISKDFN
jgi:hypothetical protein